ncbi:MAG: hypothetical protein B9S32_10885 [Verrucomicrobia bacterium Tous-C9LFEB]|nr:MAG: hypothetical protein B9S32_10885 [Verrucomicrobia bacterium Tous-C9LFEB]
MIRLDSACSPIATVPLSVRSRSRSILFSLSPEERGEFLPDWKGIDDASIHWFDGKRNHMAAWNQVLETTRPEVIVSCWSTGAIPEAFACAEDSPLRYVCHIAGSVRHVPRRFIERGGVVTNWGDAPAEPVAEHALLLALAALRNVPDWRPLIADGPSYFEHPVNRLKTCTLFGRRVGIHGFGRIARALIRLLKPFRTPIAVWSEGVPRAFIEEHGATSADSLHDLFGRSEVLFECEALTASSTGSVSANILAALPDGAVFVNVGRGRVIDEPALIQEASRGRLRVAVDVCWEDPVRSTDRLYMTPQIVLSPHIAGPTHSEFPLCGQTALENLSRYLKGETLRNRITLSQYDRAT